MVVSSALRKNDCLTGYCLEALVVLGLFCKSPLNVTLKGVTSNNLDPSVDHIKSSMLPVIKRFILDDEGLDLTISKRGKQQEMPQ